MKTSVTTFLVCLAVLITLPSFAGTIGDYPDGENHGVILKDIKIRAVEILGSSTTHEVILQTTTKKDDSRFLGNKAFSVAAKSYKDASSLVRDIRGGASVYCGDSISGSDMLYFYCSVSEVIIP